MRSNSSISKDHDRGQEMHVRTAAAVWFQSFNRFSDNHRSIDEEMSAASSVSGLHSQEPRSPARAAKRLEISVCGVKLPARQRTIHI